MEIMYNPEDVGKEVMSNRGKKIKIRKYHLTNIEMERNRKKWEEDLSGVDKKVIKLAGKYFFNPYRKGIYYYQIQSLFLLGCNKWHSLPEVLHKLSAIMSLDTVFKNNCDITLWELFKNRVCKNDPVKGKDYLGKVQENFIFFQRLSKLHPYGYKLRQVFSAVDIKRESKKCFSAGLYSYRLSTYDNIEEALPIRDFRKFRFPKHEHKYVNYKFIGTIRTKDKEIIKGVLQ